MARKELTPEQKVQRALDIWQIQNTASKHEYYHKGLKHRQELMDIWALDQPDVSWQNNKDRYVGKEELVEFYANALERRLEYDLKRAHEKDPSIEIKPENLGIGYLHVHMLTTPIIEVAGDGETAKGIWMSIGDITGPVPGEEEYGAMWAQDMYGIDFIKVDGEWKIWHLSTYVDFYTTFEESWLKNPINFFKDRPGGTPGIDAHADSKRPGNYYNAYSPKTVAQFLPRMPEPYETFSETFSY
jgi:hypothetical protein